MTHAAMEAEIRTLSSVMLAQRAEALKHAADYTAAVAAMKRQLEEVQSLVGTAQREAQLAQAAATAARQEAASLRERVVALEALCAKLAASDKRAAPAPAHPPPTTDTGTTAAQRMLQAAAQREAAAAAARDDVRRRTNANAGVPSSLGDMLTISPPKPNLMDGILATQSEVYYVLEALNVDKVDAQPRPLLSTLLMLAGFTNTLEATTLSPMILELDDHFVALAYVTFGSATQKKEYAALQQREAHERSRDTMVLRVAGADKPKRKLPTSTDGHAAATVATFDEFLMAAHEYTHYMRGFSVANAEKLTVYYDGLRRLWLTKPIFKNNLKLLKTFDPRIRLHLVHQGDDADWSLRTPDGDLEALLQHCKDQAEIEADREARRVRDRLPTEPSGRGGATRPGAGKDAGRAARHANAADPAVPLPTTVADAVADGWGSHNAPQGQQICVRHTFGVCNNTPKGNGCVSQDGQQRLHVCCFCGKSDHPVGANQTCPRPKRPAP